MKNSSIPQTGPLIKAKWLIANKVWDNLIEERNNEEEQKTNFKNTLGCETEMMFMLQLKCFIWQLVR